MKSPPLAVLIVVALTACHSHEHGHEDHGHGHDDHGHDDHGHDEHSHDERPGLSFTHWTDDTELFIELPALVVGQDSPCAAHITWLDDFSALAVAQVTVILSGGPNDERFTIDAPSIPGIFRPVAKPTSAGKRKLSVEIEAFSKRIRHDLGEITVFESPDAAKKDLPETPEPAGRIAFLKEQQWPIAFGTSVVTTRDLQPVRRVRGHLRPRPDGEITLTAPVTGRYTSPIVDGSPKIFFPSERISSKSSLGFLTPRLESADIAPLELAVQTATLEVRYAQRERERVESLVRDGALPDRRKDDADRALAEARANLESAEKRLRQFRNIHAKDKSTEGRIDLLSPIDGVLSDIIVRPESFVEAGAPLFTVTDPTTLWLEARVPESDIATITPSGKITFTPEGHPALTLAPDSFVSRAVSLDPKSRTLAYHFRFDNTANLPIGLQGEVALPAGPSKSAISVPETALVDDSGLWVVFVQVEGESFERRIIRPGVRSGGFVEILGNLKEGERVVSRGAWSVKLAASSGSVPSHGHSH
jgi:cobalt-zinc-cadmium efflux system membrane fusion protein